MHAKYALALILALQVSVSLCDVPAPSQELVNKYLEMKATFQRRVVNVVRRVHDALRPQLETENGQAFMAKISAVHEDPRYKAFRSVVAALVDEFSPMVDDARMRLLGQYEQNLRPSMGPSLNNAIETIKVFLDRYMPAE